MNAKIMIAIVATFALLFAGVAVADSADAETPETGVVKYTVGEKVFQVPFEDSKITLSDLEALGATAPEHTHFVEWKTGDNTKYVAGSTFIPTNETEEFTATFEANTYKTVFKAYDGTVLKEVSGALKTVEDDGTTIGNATPVSLTNALRTVDTAREGYLFAGWLAEGATEPVATASLGNLAGNVTYTAQYDVNYKVTFIDGDKTYITAVNPIAVPDLGEREGFTFLGWFIGETQVADPASYEFIADTTFTAKWEPVNCYVTFTAGDFSKTVPVLYGQTVGELALPEGYEAWQTKTVKVNADDTETVTYADFDFETPVKADLTLYGKETTIFSVKFVVDDNEFIMTSDKVVVPATDKTGYKFLGWAVDGEVIDLETYVIDADVVFTATFEPYTYTVTYMDGEKIVTTQTVKYGEKAILPATAFIGWQTKTIKVVEGEDGETSEVVSYADYDFNAPVTADVVLYGVTYVPEPTGMDDPVTKTVAILAGIVVLILLAVLVSKIRKGEPILGIKVEKAKKKEGEE